MMHGLLILAILSLAYGSRWLWQRWIRANTNHSWMQRWQWAWVSLALPPIALMMTAIALLLMGPQGQMVWGWEGWATDLLAIGFLSYSLWCLGQSVGAATQTLRQARQYPIRCVQGQRGRFVDSPVPFAACIGFWNAELLFSQGLLTQLTPAQVEAVFIHEQAHQTYHDTFWFFWWGWLRRTGCWLPQTDALWEELLLLRELRADQWASNCTDGLLLAESLLLMVQSPAPDALCVPFGEGDSPSRLAERIDALLTTEPKQPMPTANLVGWTCLSLALLPLLIVPFHY